MQDVQDFISSQTQHSHLIYSLRSAFPRVAPLEKKNIMRHFFFSVLLGCSVCFGLIWVHKTLSRYLIDPSGLLLINFLVANLMVVALQIPFSATSSFLGQWIFGDIGCQLYAAVGFVSGISSIFSLFLLVLEFYFYTEKTRLSSTYFQRSAKDRGFLHLKWIFAQWILALLLTGPPLMGTLGTVFENHPKSLI